MLAVKHVLQDKRYKNRELEISSKLDHPNIVKLEDYYYETVDKVPSCPPRSST